MNKVIPILPCVDAESQIAFYKDLGFQIVGQYTRSYLVVAYQDIELHFYGTKSIAPNENASMCFIAADDVDQLHDDFAENIRQATGKVPRSGFPKITKVRDLSEDRRFTLTDPSGNTFYIGTRKPAQSDTFFRDLADAQHAAQFAVLYDLVYSKEDCKVANNLLPKLLAIKEQLGDMDKAKLLLVALEIQIGLNTAHDDAELKTLMHANTSASEWDRVKIRYHEMSADWDERHAGDVHRR